MPADFAPGTGFRYPNTGCALVRRLPETVSGGPFGMLLRERLSEPLGLGDTSDAVEVGGGPDGRALTPGVGEQEPERVRHARHPLTHGPFGEDLVDEASRALDRAPCPAVRAETPSLAAGGEETLGAAAVPGEAQEPVLESSAGREVLELAGDVPGQTPALGGGPSLEGEVVLIDEPVDQGMPGAAARVCGRTAVRTSTRADCGRHERVPAMTFRARR